MLISIDPNSSVPIYMQLIDCITELIEKGVLSAGERLPSVRSLAAELVVNPNTIQKAYTELERRNLISRRAGVHGCFVNENPMLHSGAAERDGTEWERMFTLAVKSAKESGADKERLIALIEELYFEEQSQGDE
ncbi:MAG: GntR family transcriptional regulator [Clostridia bacterium]|nr:GntR family transcriptional regulator [Clostridia bacterium]